MSGFSAYFASPESQAPFKEAGLIRLRGSLFAIIEAAALDVPECPSCYGKTKHYQWCHLRDGAGYVSQKLYDFLRSRTASGIPRGVE